MVYVTEMLEKVSPRASAIFFFSCLRLSSTAWMASLSRSRGWMIEIRVVTPVTALREAIALANRSGLTMCWQFQLLSCAPDERYDHGHQRRLEERSNFSGPANRERPRTARTGKNPGFSPPCLGTVHGNPRRQKRRCRNRGGRTSTTFDREQGMIASRR